MFCNHINESKLYRSNNMGYGYILITSKDKCLYNAKIFFFIPCIQK